MAKVPCGDKDCKGLQTQCEAPDYIYKSGEELYNGYCQILDRCHPQIEICGYTYKPSMVFREVDPIAFTCNFIDYAENLFCLGEVSEEIINLASIYLPK